MYDFSERGEKKGKAFKNLGKNVQNLKIFWKSAGDCVQESYASQSVSWKSAFYQGW